MSNMLYDQSYVSNTANQISYLDYSNSSDRFAGVNSYPSTFLKSIFEVPAFKKPNHITLKAIKEIDELGECKRFTSIEELFDDLEG